MVSHKLNRSAFKAQTAADAADHARHYKNLSWQDRLRITAYLNSMAFNYPLEHPPAMDKTAFKAKDLNDLENL
ncbi:hypothetical protein ABDK00_011120 [Niabella insulamsoli]|uniref:hypothetical protein n=1 Tax=Niabella insulamsoli TaxID=3144874 RepID=UPI0031FE25AB